MSETYYIGWDVGGWKCKPHKDKSCDALVVLNMGKQKLGFNRENLAFVINKSESTLEFTVNLLSLCGIDNARTPYNVIIAIDTPLGYSKAFLDLICNYSITAIDEKKEHINNPYLFRKTEQSVFEKTGKRPLSALNDRIGNQSTKGIHVIGKFAPDNSSCGVWQNGNLTIIETYPSVNAQIEIPDEINGEHQDIQDAYRCAYIAYLFQNEKERLETPPKDIPKTEGWIWYLKKEEKTLNKA